VIYAAAHKNFSTSGVCYTVIRKDLINEDVHKFTPTMCNWNRYARPCVYALDAIRIIPLYIAICICLTKPYS